jgi:catechol 2,3-dioxygenase-like lactoylglutathione lyase family enzyme
MSEKKPGEALPFLRNGIAQVALVVPDLEAAVDSYWKLFGIGPWHFYTYGQGVLRRMSYRGRPAEYRMRIALAWAGPQRIELIQMEQGETVYSEFVLKHGYGLHHLGVLVEDMEAALRQAEAAGLHMIMDGAGFGQDGDGHYAYLDTEDLLGTTIELIQRPRRRRTPDKVYPLE